jgi:hypothetical protein
MSWGNSTHALGYLAVFVPARPLANVSQSSRKSEQRIELNRFWNEVPSIVR